MNENAAHKRRKTCCVCGELTEGAWEQWWNRDSGFGLCPPCGERLIARGTPLAEMRDLYGLPGVHRAATQAEAHLSPCM